MNNKTGSLEWFLKLPQNEICEILRNAGRPNLGIFVPDGSRRLTLAYTKFEPDTSDFLTAVARLPAKFLFQTIHTFFEYGLPILFIPILGRSLFNRGAKYQQFALLEGLRIIFGTREWKNFYEEYDIRVRVYGDPLCLKGTPCELALEWIERICQSTKNHQSFSLYYAIGESSIVGEKSAINALRFFQQNHRIPTLQEQIEFYYGELLPSADFFMMTSKMSGMGAMPDLLVNGDTEIYYLPTAMGLTDRSYRLILYDLLYSRSPLRAGLEKFDISTKNRKILRSAYESSANSVVGLGFSIGKIWVMKENKRNKI
jgi:hypothetical protein